MLLCNMWLCNLINYPLFPYNIKVLIGMSLHAKWQNNLVDFELPICFPCLPSKTVFLGSGAKWQIFGHVFTFSPGFCTASKRHYTHFIDQKCKVLVFVFFLKVNKCSSVINFDVATTSLLLPLNSTTVLLRAFTINF